MHHTALQVLKPGGTVAMIAKPGSTNSLPGGCQVLGIIQGDAVPQSFILIGLYKKKGGFLLIAS